MSGKRVPSVEVSDPIPLLKFDEGGDTWVQFQRPRRWEREQLSRLRAQTMFEWDSEERGTVRQRDMVPETVMDSERLAITLVDSNLMPEDEKDNTPIFVPGKTCRMARKRLSDSVKDRFYVALFDLDDDLVEEIIEALHEWHPPFDWRNPDRQGE